MNRKPFYTFLVVLAVLCGVFCLTVDAGDILISALSFPFAQIGTWLRVLSLSSMTGNIAAWALYLTFSLIPLVGFFYIHRRYHAEKCDLLLPLLTMVLLMVLYKMVNPFGSLYADSETGTAMYKAQYGAVVYVILLGWLILRAVANFSSADEQGLYTRMGYLLKLLATLFVVSVFGGFFGNLLGTIETIRTTNTDGGSLTLTYLFVTLQCLVDALPLLLDTVAAVMALDLLEAFTGENEHTAVYADRLAKWCGTTLTVTTIAGIVFHVLQMLFLNKIRSSNVSVTLPVGSITFLLVCLIAARIIAENKTLKDDNDLFI